MAEPRLSVENLTVRRDGRTIVDDVSLALDDGDVLTIQGASGCGKSTLLRAIATLIPRSSGRTRFAGRDAADIGLAEYRRRVAYVPQTPRMFEGTVADNIRAGPGFRGARPSDADVERLLEQVGLSRDVAPRMASELSGGERLRVALARALANDPRVLLLDEPTSALDPDAARVVIDLVRGLAQGGTAVLAVTHVEEHAARFDGARYRMTSGVLRAEDGSSS